MVFLTFISVKFETSKCNRVNIYVPNLIASLLVYILKYKWILRFLKHARFFDHDGAAGAFEIEQVF
jgi:hypothetical protein